MHTKLELGVSIYSGSAELSIGHATLPELLSRSSGQSARNKWFRRREHRLTCFGFSQVPVTDRATVASFS